MIIQETYQINGIDFVRSYSDAEMMIEREGILYDEAHDPAEFNRTYTETDIPIEDDELDPQEALSIITGGET